jgi:hypothetical protein
MHINLEERFPCKSHIRATDRREPYGLQAVWSILNVECLTGNWKHPCIVRSTGVLDLLRLPEFSKVENARVREQATSAWPTSEALAPHTVGNTSIHTRSRQRRILSSTQCKAPTCNVCWTVLYTVLLDITNKTLTQTLLWRLSISGTSRRVARVRTEVSEENIASISE